MVLLGISQGAAVCIEYAVRHPERVSHLVLYGGYAHGVSKRDDADAARVYAAIIDLARLGWGTDNPANAEIAERLALSEKTVRNHVSNLFDKLGVWTRAQAIVFARDRGFRA
jgi:DNA-binding CsgD family transcriptional regulator